MRDMRILMTSVLIAATGILAPARAEMVTPGEAVTVAQNWITLISEKEGSWGGAKTAQLNGIYDLRRGGRLLGYLFRVEPQGYIVVSLRKELPPVQAYSDTGDLDPQSDTQREGIIKEEMARLLDDAEGLIRPQLSIQSEALLDASQAENRAAWETFRNGPEAFASALRSGKLTIAYESGKVLLTSSWDQGDPYNRKCPPPSSKSTCSEALCPVGCTPLAGAQVMRYWAWPPGYDWRNMPDKLDSNSPEAQIEAVATLCRDVGAKAGAIYCVPGPFGCQTFLQLIDNPLVWGDPDLLEALVDNFLYHEDADGDWRITESAAEWFGYFKKALDQNRPVPYELGTEFHTIVCDGWREVAGARQLHLNYGWGGANNDWWTVDTQPNRGKAENIIRGLRPNCAVGTVINGKRNAGLSGGRSFVYFDQDATPAGNAEYISFNCQFLPGVTLRTDPATGFSLSFAGSPDSNILYSIKGTSQTTILLEDGAAIKLEQGGCIRFY